METNTFCVSETEVLYRGKVTFETKTVKLYSQILEYQIRLASQCSRHTLSRYLRDVVCADNWKAMLDEVKDLEQSITKYLREIDGYTMKVIDAKISQSLDFQSIIVTKIEARHFPSSSPYYTYAFSSLSSSTRALQNSARDLINRKDV